MITLRRFRGAAVVAGTTLDVPTPASAAGVAPPPDTKVPSTAPVAPRLGPHEKKRIRIAAFQARTIYGGAIGELVCRELLCWEEFGYRLDNGGLAARLVDQITNA